jgi:alpha-amylase
VIGDSDHLGNWIPSQAPRLSTTALTFPLWEGTVSLPRGETYRYKYVIINQKTQLIKWESKKKDFRTVTTTGWSFFSFIFVFYLHHLLYFYF